MIFDPLEFLRQKELLDTQSDISASTLDGGFWNDNFRLTGEGIDWVVKHYRRGQKTSLFPILPDQESHALTSLQGCEIAPDPVSYFPGKHSVLVYEYWPGDPWQEDVIPVAHLLRRLHGVQVRHPGSFRKLITNPTGLLHQGDEMLSGAGSDSLSQRLARLRPDPVRVPDLPKKSLLHTDVGAGNIIVGPRGTRLIDWQCPGMGDPAEDLWAFLSPAFQMLFERTPIAAAQRAAFLGAYGNPETTYRLNLLSPFFSYRMSAYCCLRSLELQETDPKLSVHYRKAAGAQIEELETGRTQK
jgi:Ser/Thr protein kinase RdoA (MazF antagonist)